MSQLDTSYYFLQQINPWWETKSFRYRVKARESYHPLLDGSKNNLIKILVGARRVGKTSLLFHQINKLLSKKISSKKILFLSGDLRDVQQLGLLKIIKLHAKQQNINLSHEKLYIFIDEVQEIPRWQEEIKFLYDNFTIQLYISGSTGDILSKKTAKLTGRYTLIRVLPLSYKEFLKFKGLSVQENFKKDTHLRDFLTTGGYPENVTSQVPNYLQDVVDSTLYRDLLEYYGIRQPTILEEMLRFMADKATNEISQRRLSRDLKIDSETVKNYLQYLEAVYIVFPLYKHAYSNKKSKNQPPKYYFNDSGILNALGIQTRLGHLAENAVFVQLLRKQYNKERYTLFYENINGQEYDFYNGEQLFEVKMNDKVTLKELEKYELRGREAQLYETPIIIGTPKIKKLIKKYSLELAFANLHEFLL